MTARTYSPRRRAYSAWINAKARCTRESHPVFAHYGGRGIRVCERWLRFEHFLADMGEPPDGMSLDRIDVNGNYEPDNCRWTTQTYQLANRRKQRGCTSKYRGVSLTRNGRWTVRLDHEGKRYLGGNHLLEDDAARAYNRIALKFGYPPNPIAAGAQP